MIRRPRRSLPAALVALVVLAACAFVAVSCVQYLIGERPWLTFDTAADAVRGIRWDGVPVLVAGGVVAVVGLVLLLAAVLPGKPIVLPLAPSDRDETSGATRRSVHGELRQTVASVDGVSSAKVKLRTKKLTARVRTSRTVTEGLADAVSSALETRLDQIAPAKRPRVRVRVKKTRSS
ncbi:DUF6286 domain-containing protein [Amycolatopsis sp. CA-230715]|uniref:DUF6286 domain-containing protein n=1 Tax=Amycolatopsis sp. CA-230715 TaxID=2745196 RepID=UPI001C00B5E3|nr:DUF6286 domain-containing protein [Amycolatopsis sp. CA-230715]QWF80749.1 hypothetical protein HUW46_04173 [Amycolatopsis sp. CA-230715]